MWDMREAFPFGRLSTRNIFLFVASLVATIFATLLVATTPVAAADADITWQDSEIIYDNRTYRGPTLSNDRAGYELPVETILYINAEGNTRRVIYFPADSKPGEASSAQFVTYRSNASGMLSDKSPPVTLSIDAASRTDAPSSEAGDTTSSCEVSGIGYVVCPVTIFLAEGMDWIFDVLKQFVEVTPLTTDGDSPMRRAWEIMRSFANVAFVIAFIIIIYSQLTSIGMSNYGIKKLLPRIIISAILVNVSYWICVIAIDASNILGNSLQGVFEGLRNMVGINNSAPINWSDLATFILSAGALGSVAAGGLVLGANAIGAMTVGGLALLLLPILVGAITTILVVVFILAARQALITILVIIAPLAFVAYLLPNTEKWFEKWRSIFVTMMVFFPAFSVIFGGSQFAGAMIINNAETNLVLIILGMAVQIAPLAITPLILKLSGTLLSRIGGLINDPTRGFKDRTKNWSKDRLAASRANQMRKNYDMEKAGKLKGRHAVRRSALNSDQRRRMREGEKSANETQATSLFNESESGYALHKLQHAANMQKERVENELKTKIQAEVNVVGSKLHADTLTLEAGKIKLDNVETDGKTMLQNHIGMPGSALHDATTRSNISKSTLEDAENQVKTMYQNMTNDQSSALHLANTSKEASASELKTAQSTTARILEEYQTDAYAEGVARDDTVDDRVKRDIARFAFTRKEVGKESLATQRAKEKGDSEFAEYIQSSEEARIHAAGSMGGGREAMLALADATKTASGHYNQGVDNANAILSAGNYSDEQIRHIAEGNDGGTGLDVTVDMQIAAIRKTAGGKNAGEIVQLMKNLDNIHKLPSDVRQELGDALLSNSAKPAWISAGTIGAIKSGDMKLNGNERIDQWVLSTMKDGGISGAEAMLSQDKAYIKTTFEAIRRANASGTIESSPAVQSLTSSMSAPDKAKYIETLKDQLNTTASQIHTIHHDNRFAGRVGKRDENMGYLYNELVGTSGVTAEQPNYEEAKKHQPTPAP